MNGTSGDCLSIHAVRAPAIKTSSRGVGGDSSGRDEHRLISSGCVEGCENLNFRPWSCWVVVVGGGGGGGGGRR